jgi:hypothetical protein
VLLAKYYLFDQNKKNDMGGASSVDGRRTGVYRVLAGKPKGKSPIRRPRRGWEDNIKMRLRMFDGGGHGLDRCGSGQGQVAGTCECGNEIPGSIKCGEFLY